MGAKRHKKQNKSSQKPPHLRCRTAVPFTHPRVKQRSSHRCCGAWVIHPALPDSSYRTFGCYRGHFFNIFLVGPICHSFKWQLPEMTYHLHSLPISQLGKVRAPAFIYGPQGSAAFRISSSWFSFFVDLR